MIGDKNWKEVKDLIYDLVSAKDVEWITETEACKILNIETSTLKKRISKGKISSSMYRVDMGKIKFFNKQEIIKTLKTKNLKN